MNIILEECEIVYILKTFTANKYLGMNLGFKEKFKIRNGGIRIAKNSYNTLLSEQLLLMSNSVDILII